MGGCSVQCGIIQLGHCPHFHVGPHLPDCPGVLEQSSQASMLPGACLGLQQEETRVCQEEVPVSCPRSFLHHCHCHGNHNISFGFAGRELRSEVTGICAEWVKRK